MAVWVLRYPLQHMPMAVKTAMALPLMMPSVMKRGTKPSAAPTAPSAVIGNDTSAPLSKPKSQ